MYFRKDQFAHSFFESSRKDNNTDFFSPERSERIDWIKATPQNSSAELYCGWISKKKKVDPNSRVSVVYGNFVVVILIKKNKRNGKLRGQFITAYLADNSIGKIKRNPKWNISLIK